MEVTVPVNSSATIIIPTGNPESVIENGKSVQNRTDIKVLEAKDDFLVLLVGSGTPIIFSQ